MGARGPRRNKAERERDLVIVARMYLGAHPQHEIAAEVNKKYEQPLTRQQMSYDIKKVIARWQKSQLIDIDAAKARELERVDWLEYEARAAWVRSQKPAMTETSELLGAGELDAKGKIKGQRVKHVTVKKGQVGDRSFLAQVDACIDKRCKILGLYASSKVEVYDWRKEAKEHGIDNPDALLDGLAREFAEAMQGRDAARGVKASKENSNEAG